MSAEDRAKQALETLARALASEGTLRASVRDLRTRLGEARVRLLDQVVSTIAQHPVNTQPRRLFKQAASLAAEALNRPSEPPRPAPVVEVRSAPTPPAPRPPAPKVATPPAPPSPKPVARSAPPRPAQKAPERSIAGRLVLMARDPEWLYAYWELEPGTGKASNIELVLFDADTGARVDEVHASSSDLHASFRRPGAGRRFVAILDADGKIWLRSATVEVPSAAPAAVEPVRFVAPAGRSPAVVAAAIKDAPLVSPARILGWSPDLWRSFAERIASIGAPSGSSPGSP